MCNSISFSGLVLLCLFRWYILLDRWYILLDIFLTLMISRISILLVGLSHMFDGFFLYSTCVKWYTWVVFGHDGRLGLGLFDSSGTESGFFYFKSFSSFLLLRFLHHYVLSFLTFVFLGVDPCDFFIGMLIHMINLLSFSINQFARNQ